MKNKVLCRSIVLMTIVLFISASVVPSTVGTTNENTVTTAFGSRGYIQDLIDNASDGDTIYIPSGFYHEDIVINKSINLIGENKNTTIIQPYFSEYNIYIVHNCVNISGFTIKNNQRWQNGVKINSCRNNLINNIFYSQNDNIRVDSDNNTICSNTILESTWGVMLYGDANTVSGNNIITSHTGIDIFGDDNIIINNTIINQLSGDVSEGIVLYGDRNNISSNIITTSNFGIWLSGVSNTIYGNIILGINCGVMLYGDANTVSSNNISNNGDGINLTGSSNNTIHKNNFLNNKKDAFFNNSEKNTWKQNYWNRSRILPKLIFGKIAIGPIEIPWFNIDWHPAFKPYDIPGIT